MANQEYLKQNEKFILDSVNSGKSKRYIARSLNCNVDTLDRFLKSLGIAYKGLKAEKGVCTQDQYIPLETYLKSSKCQNSRIRGKLFKEGYKERKCECCGRTTWQGKPIPLELHHIDGNPKNNTLINFQILCPNCHALTDNYRGKNKKTGKA